MQFCHETLDNGLEIVGETNPSARSVAVGFFVRTGARDETAAEAGVSHFLEHMVFKGTERRTYLDVNRDFDRMGAHYNAFTSEENTVFHATVLPEFLSRTVDLLADILRPSLRAEDFDMEKKVIIEEIGMYDDQPMSVAYDRIRRAHFGAHPLGNSVLGTAASVGALSREQMHDYFERRYIAPNITAVAAGNFRWDDFRTLIERQCGGWPTGKARRSNLREARGSGAFEVMSKSKVAQENVVMMAAGPAASAPLRHAASVLGMILGDDSGSRLYWALIDPGLAESADAGFHDYDGAGAYFVTMSCEPGRTQRNLGVIQGVLDTLQAEGPTEEELQQAKSKVQARLVRYSERPGGRMRAVGMSWVYLREYRSVDDELQAFDAVSLKKIRQVLDKYPINRMTTLALGPLKKLKPVNGTNGRR